MKAHRMGAIKGWEGFLKGALETMDLRADF